MLYYESYKPSELSKDTWLELQSLQRDAFETTLPNRTAGELDELVAIHDSKSFYDSHIDPNTARGGRFNSAQSYWRPRVIVAKDDDEIIGFGYAANNVSGTKTQQMIKLAGIQKKYLWIREVAVRPDHQRQQIGKTILQELLSTGSEKQPVTAYTWPKEIPFMDRVLWRYGFEKAGTQEVSIFGPESNPVEQVRIVGASVSSVQSRLRE